MQNEKLFSLLDSVNHSLIMTGTAPENAADQFLSAISPHLWDGIKPNSTIYLHSPRQNGKYVRNFTGIVPKTAIFADNFFELEVLRFLKFYKDDEATDFLCAETVKRLADTCFGSFCPTGECIGASIAALRFYNAVQPDSSEVEQLSDRLCAYYTTLPGGMSAYTKNMPRFYFFLAMTDVQTSSAKAFLHSQKRFMHTMLTRGCLTGPAIADTYNPRILYILRNAMAALPEYKSIKTHPVIVREDGRCVLTI